MSKLAATTAVFAFAVASAVNAAPITGVTATTTFNQCCGSSINNIVNGSGLSSYTAGATHAAGAPSNAWASDPDEPPGSITFDLGDVFDLSGMAVWNFNANNLSGVQRLQIFGSTDGSIFSLMAGAPSVFAIGANSAAELAEQFAFSTTASHVRFDVQSNYDLFVGLSEVMFLGDAAVVPEPATLALLGLGLAGLGFSRRKQ
jgi:hypothetical protein